MVKWKSGSHAFKMEIIYGRQSPQPFVPPPLAAHLHFRQLTKDPTKDNASSKNKPSELSYELMHVALGDFVILNLQDFYYEILWHVLSQIFPFSVFLFDAFFMKCAAWRMSN